MELGTLTVLITTIGDTEETFPFNVDLKEIFQFQEIIMVKARPDLLSGDHLMEHGTSMDLTITIGDTEENFPFNVDLKEMFQYQLITVVKERLNLLYGDHLMELGTSMDLTITIGDMEENSLSNVDLMEIFQYQLIITVKEEPELLFGDQAMANGISMEPMEAGDQEVRKFTNTEVLEMLPCHTSMEEILTITFMLDPSQDIITNIHKKKINGEFTINTSF